MNAKIGCPQCGEQFPDRAAMQSHLFASEIDHQRDDKHKGDVMGREQKLTIVGASEDIVRLLDKAQYSEDVNDRVTARLQITNQHAQLVEQRNRLIATIERVRSMLVYVRDLNRLDLVKQQTEQGVIEIGDALATVERGG